MPFAATWMDLEIIILSEGSQTERQIPYDIKYVDSKKVIQMNSLIKRKQTHRHGKQTYGY